MNEPKYRGKEMTIGGEKMVIPGLSTKQTRHYFGEESSYLERISTIRKRPTSEQTAALLEICTAAMSRNYPEATPEWLDEQVTPGELMVLTRTALEQTGFLYTPQEEGKEQAP